MNPTNLLVVGSANIDLVTRVQKSPVPGQTVMGKSFATVAGGKGANQAVAAARLGAHTLFAGCVGDDMFGDMQRESLRSAGVDISHLRRHAKEPTGTAVILVADEGQNSIVVTPAANFCLKPDDVLALGPVFEKMDVVLVQLEIPLATAQTALEMARHHGALAVLDIGSDQPVSDELLSKADIVSPNETEAAALTGMSVDTVEEARAAAQEIRRRSGAEVVMKLGSRGCFYLGDDELLVPPFEVEAVDTTAAGDAFTAALSIAWQQLSRADALRFANATGALAATVAGAQPSMPSLAMVEELLKQQT